MEGMQRYGWSLVDSNGVKASALIFKTEFDADQYKEMMNERHPEGRYELVELFVRNGDTWDR